MVLFVRRAKSGLFAWLWLAGLLATSGLGAAEPARRDFNIPPGAAAQTFKQFATQSGRGLIADAEVIRGVKTNAVQGSYTVGEVLARMLAGTSLLAKEDAQSGAFVVQREDRRPNGERAALRQSSGRPGP